MVKIQFPDYDFKIVSEGPQSRIFDPFRKQWLILTPEEWVRQNILVYISEILKYPAALLSIEKEISLGELKKRCDIIVYDRSMQPWMIIECKERKVDLDETVLNQVLRYHASQPCKYLTVSNGTYTYCFVKEKGTFKEIHEMPFFEL